MAVLRSLRRAVAGLARNPVVFVVTAALALVQLPQLAAQAIGPAVATVASTVFGLGFVVVVPFVQGGAIAMADEALDGRTRLRTFVRAGRANYVQLLIGYALLLGVNMAIVVGGLLVGLLGAVVVFVLVPDPTSTVVPLVVLALIGLVVLLAYLAVAFVVQFYGQAIVLDDLPAVDGFKRSVRLVRDNPVPVVGYTLLAGSVGGLYGLVVGALSILLSTRPDAGLDVPQLTLAGQVGAALGVVVVTTLLGAVLLVYSVAFYRAIRPGPTPGDRPTRL